MATQSELSNSIAKLKRETQLIVNDIPVLKFQLSRTDSLSCYLLDRLLIGTQLTTSCALLSEKYLSSSVVILVRALLEHFVAVYWASLDEENGKILIGASNLELLRIAKINVERGNAVIRHRITKEDLSSQFLQEPKLRMAKAPPRFDQMAEGANIKKIYDMLYRFLSVLSHGSATEILVGEEQVDSLQGYVLAALCLCQCMHLIVRNRIIKKCTTSKDDIASILNLSLD